MPAYLTFLAGKISNSASATYRPKFGVGITDWRIMALLATEPWITAGRVCDVIGLDKAAVSRSVREMKKLGIVEADEDQYRQLIALTRKGLSLHDRIVTLSLERERHLLKGFSAAERKLLINFLSRMRAGRRPGLTRRRLPPWRLDGTFQPRSKYCQIYRVCSI